MKKCEDPKCCSPKRAPSGVLSTLHWLPDPQLSEDSSLYKKFEAVYGKDTTEEDLAYYIHACSLWELDMCII